MFFFYTSNEPCDFNKQNSKCYFGDYELHQGTEEKLSIVEKYVRNWIQKIVGVGKYDSVAFVDAMCSSGKYLSKYTKDVIDGTSLRVYNAFSDATEQYPNFNFHLFLNDINPQAIECQKCHIQNKKPTIHVEYSVSDVSAFMDSLSTYIKSSDFSKCHFIIFYDPYIADIRWSDISNFSNAIRGSYFAHFDLLLTHFHQNDISRAIGLVKEGSEAYNRYESTYQMKVPSIISCIRDLGPFEKSRWFRERIADLLVSNLHVKKTDLSYFPIFNTGNKSVYDLVHFSQSKIAKALFKTCVYDIVVGNRVSIASHNMQLFFEEDTLKEDEIFFSHDNYANIIANNFAGRIHVQYQEIKNFVDNHPYIVLKPKKLIEALKNGCNVSCSSDRAFENKVFNFSNSFREREG